MWIDTHCHLDAPEFEADRWAIAQAAISMGVHRIVIPAVTQARFKTVRDWAHRIDSAAYTLGIHPFFVAQASEVDIPALRSLVEASLEDPHFVGMGEIGLDHAMPNPDVERQRFFYFEQLKIARDFDLPVICHARKAQDLVLAGLRCFSVTRGVLHAFNGSFQQARAFLNQGFKLGFGGKLTFDRAHQIRRLATQLPLEALVLETDAPDMSPAWCYREHNAPTQLPRIAQTLAALRSIAPETLAHSTTANAYAALPRLALSAA
jgi:TatD DNase family protein